MGKVYRIGSLDGDVAYVNTAREVDSFHPDGYEEAERVDAAEECNRLQDEVDAAERTIIALRNLLADLVEMCPDDVLDTPSGKRAKKFVDDNPLPPATAADRDGSRSYGAG